MLNRKKHIKTYLKALLGAPVVSLCDGEISALDDAVELASLEYWVNFPYEKKKHYRTHTKCGELVLNIEDEKNSILPESLQEISYPVGLIRYDLLNSTVPTISNSNFFDTQLLGANVSMGNNNFPTQDPRYTADRLNYLNSNEDMWIGELDIEFDSIQGLATIIHPPMEGQLHLWWAYGFCTEKSIDLVPINMLPIFKKMVGLQFIEIVIASRTAIRLQSDFEVDVTSLEAIKERLQEQLDKERPELTTFVAQWG